MEAFMQTTKSLAIVIPVFNEGPYFKKNFLEILKTLRDDNIPCRFMLVDDGSHDESWAVIESLCNEYEFVDAIRFSRNFGKEIAICAGLDHIDADLYITMDSDLQHPPRFIPDMLKLMETENVNMVEGIKSNRGKEKLKSKFFAKSFYSLLHKITGLEMDNSSDFKLMDRSVIENIRNFGERNIFFRGLVDWVGFSKANFYFDVDERKDGGSSFSILKLIALAINAILAYTSKPLYLTIMCGVLFFIFAVVLGIQTLYNFFSGIAVSGFSTVILLILITGSMVMFCLGIIGLYISRIYDEVKNRPRYIISKKINER